MKNKYIFSFILFQIFTINIYSQTDTVNIYNMSFKPATLTISAGKRVVWINKTNQDHTSTSGINCTKDGQWNSGYISEGQNFSRTFDSVGTYNYFCIPHCLSGIKGKIIVKKNENSSKENEALKKKKMKSLQ